MIDDRIVLMDHTGKVFFSVGTRLGVGGALLVLLLVMIGTCMDKAQAEDFPPGDDQIVPLAEGERAPFDGQLFSTDTSIRWGFRLQRLRLQLEEDVAREQEICAAQTDLLETKMRLTAENTEFQLQTLQEALNAERQTSQDLATQLSVAGEIPWYKTWEFGFGVGLVVAVLFGGLGGWLVHSLA